MNKFDFGQYCSQFLENETLGDLPFFKDEEFSASYRELIELSLSLAQTLKEEPDSFYALKIDSPYFLFAHLLGSLFAQKKALVLSVREPEKALSAYKARLGFKRVIPGVIGKNTPIKIPHVPLDAHAVSLLSSGSSGASKKIALTLSNVYHSAQGLIDLFAMNEKETTFMNLPHHHVGGLMILWRAFFSKGSVTTLEHDNFHYISLVPLQLRRFMDEPDKLEKLKKCKAILIGGAPFDEDLKKMAQAHHLFVFETYGMTETSSLVMLNGSPLKDQQIKLDSEGHFLIKGPTLSPDVLVDAEGFLHTKDVGVKKSDGTFTFLYRSDLLFKSAGEMINPQEIERKLKPLPWIAEAISVPIKHPEWTFAQALVYKTTDAKKGAWEIREFLKQEVHPFLVPRFFYEASEGLFKEGIKPRRFEIRDFAQESYFKERLHYVFLPHPKAEKLVVLLHGFMEEHTDMLSLVDTSLPISYLMIDFPGHGKSPISSFKNRQDIFVTLAELIKFYSQNLDCILYGYSMGGRVALELVMDHLQVEQLILESAHFGLNDHTEQKARLNSDQHLFDHVSDLKVFFEEWYKNPIFAGFRPELSQKITHDKNEWQGALNFISPGNSPYLFDEAIQKLKAIKTLKILGITGELDQKYNDHFKMVKTKLENFDHHEIKKTGHNPHKTHPVAVKLLLTEAISSRKMSTKASRE